MAIREATAQPHAAGNDLAAMAEELMRLLKNKGLTLVVAESCTAGLMGKVLSDAPGAGELFHGGFVTYTKAHKTSALDVPMDMLRQKGAVCVEVARAMAQGALAHSPAQLSAAITGVAGPEPDPDRNPVGRVCIAVARQDAPPTAFEKNYGDIGRDAVRECAIADAFARADRGGAAGAGRAAMSEAEKKVKIALDGCRVLMLGAQILFGFHLRAVFQDEFTDLSSTLRILYVFAFAAMAVVVALLIAPSMQHRIVERGRTSGRIVEATTLFASLALAPFALSLGADIAIVFSFKFGVIAGATLGYLIAALALALWYGIEYLLRRPNGRERAMPEEPDTPIDVRVEHMLTESRVLLPGAQALFGFQLTVLLTPAFDKLAENLKLTHAFALCSIALTIILLMTPAALHRISFGGRNTKSFHRMGSAFVIAAAVPLALGISADLYVAISKALGSMPLGAAVAGALAVLLAVLWFVQPLALRQRHHREPRPEPAM